MIAVPAPTASADTGGEARLRDAGDRLVAAASWGGAGGGDGTVSAAEVRSSGDAAGDVPYCQGDIRSFAVNYGSTVDVSATSACSSNPGTSPNWVDGASVIGWFFDHTYDGTLDYGVFYGNDGTSVIAQVVRLSDEVTTCQVAGSWDGNKTYSTSFAPSCFGNPSRTHAGVLFLWDENPSAETCECPIDAAPEEVMIGPIWKGQPPAPGTGGSGYWMLREDGVVYAFGAARHYGDANVGGAIATDIDARPNDNAGYWVVDNQGHVFAFGSAGWHGNATGLQPGEQTTSIAGTKSGNGYYIFTDRGRAFTFGDAVFRGDMRGIVLNGPVLDSNVTGAGTGYYMVASDGGVFSFNTPFYGSMGGKRLNQPVNGMATDPDNAGYWLVAGDGGVFSFNANFKGSMGSTPLNKPVVGMVAYGNGYLMVASDGGIFNFSNKAFVGSLGSNPPPIPIISVAPVR
ncbi:MAG TPA: hypothetical protein VM938_04605 [Acidimicrobiales bacterium]|nr:hypothetical protein [Acidimicrobiales bacterium]